MLSYIVWDAPKEMFSFSMPLLGRPILWYGFFFALGFFLGYFVLVYLLNRYYHQEHLPLKGKALAESALIYVMVGAIIGARLGDILFYQHLQGLLANPLQIFAVWEGGLSSHGGTVGALIALLVFVKKHKKPLMPLASFRFIDLVCVPAALVSFFIRIGNFFNQEILGIKTDLSIGVIFAHPIDGSYPAPRHAVQLYEAFFYLALFFALLFFAKKAKTRVGGQLTALFITLIYSFRFLIEFLKEEQSSYQVYGGLTMGQYLSIPLVLASLCTFLWLRKKRPGVR